MDATRAPPRSRPASRSSPSRSLLQEPDAVHQAVDEQNVVRVEGQSLLDLKVNSLFFPLTVRQIRRQQTQMSFSFPQY